MSVATLDLPRTAVVDILRKMYRIRHFETQVIELFQEGQIRGSTHTYIGMEGLGRRLLLGAAAGRLHHVDPPRPRPLHRQGRPARPDDGRAARQGDRLLQGQGRLDAHRRRRRRHPRRERDRRRRDRDRDRRRARQPAARRRPGRGLLLRRRRLQPGHPPRERQHRRALEAAGRLLLREQPVRDVDPDRALERGRRPLGPRGRLRHAGRRTSTAWTSLAVREAVHHAVERARRGDGPSLLGLRDLPLRGAQRRRRAALPDARGGRALAGERPDPALPRLGRPRTAC